MTGLDPEYDETPRRAQPASKPWVAGMLRDGHDECPDCNNSGRMWIGNEEIDCPTCGGASAASKFLRRRLRTEAEARGDQARDQWKVATGYRIEPTPEDAQIATRMARRLMNWALRENNWRRLTGRPALSGSEFIAITKRATLDILEFGPVP